MVVIIFHGAINFETKSDVRKEILFLFGKFLKKLISFSKNNNNLFLLLLEGLVDTDCFRETIPSIEYQQITQKFLTNLKFKQNQMNLYLKSFAKMFDKTIKGKVH